MSKQQVVMGAFRSFAVARDAIYAIESAGVPQHSISLVGPEHTRDEFAQLEKKTKAGEGAGIGGAAGVALGSLIAGLTAVAAVVVPGVGVLVAGPLVAALAGAGAGGVAGGVVGALVGLGITEHEAKFHTSVLKEGGYIVAVTSDDKHHIKRAEEILERLSVKSDKTTGTTAYVAK